MKKILATSRIFFRKQKVFFEHLYSLSKIFIARSYTFLKKYFFILRAYWNEYSKKTKLIILSVSISFLVMLPLSFLTLRYYNDYKRPNFRKRVQLYVYPQMGLDSLLKQLSLDNNIIRPKSIRRVFRKLNVANRLRRGHYIIDSKTSSVQLARRLVLGSQTPVNLVLSGTIRSHSSLAKKISKQLLLDSLSVIEALRDSSLLSRYGVNKETVYSLFFLDTYQMYWTASMVEVLNKQKEKYDRFWNDDRLKLALKQGLSPFQVVTLASIVSSESNYSPEYPRIAEVYLNRLKRGMKLQADPTVAFCYDYKLNRVLTIHTKVNSPYNTYRNYGLPPAPICIPNRLAIEAVLTPSTEGNVYFCAASDFTGKHIFAKTYSAHLKNAKRFQRALSIKNRQEAKKKG